MATVNSLQCYKGENVQFNFGLAPSSLTTVPLAAGQATVPVVSTAGFPASGTAYLLPPTAGAAVTAITYTGLTPGSLTGCASVPAIATAGALVTSGSVDITTWTMQFTLKVNQTDPTALLTKVPTIVSGPGSIFRVSLAKADTNRRAAIYQHDVFRTDGGSEACLSVGPFTILQEVLNP